MLGTAAASTAAPCFQSHRTRCLSSSSASASSFLCAQCRTLSVRRLRCPNSTADAVAFALTRLSFSSSPQEDGRPESTDDEGPDLCSISCDDEDVVDGDGEDGFQLVIEKKNNNRRRIRSRVRIDADLETVWSVLTDYEGLASFVPSLAVSRLLDKKDKFARVYQVGRQDLALGLKFDANGVIDCYERDLEIFPDGCRRDIDFEMVEGDFETFEGKWSIEQIDYGCNNKQYETEYKFQTALNYVVELQPKLWLPVGLIEGKVCREIKNNLFCVRDEAQRIQRLKASKLSE